MNVHSPIPLHDTHSYETRYRAEDPWDVPDSQVPLLLTQVFPWGRKHGFSKLKTYTDRKMVGGDLYLNQLVAGKHESDLGTPMPQVTVMAIKKTTGDPLVLRQTVCRGIWFGEKTTAHCKPDKSEMMNRIVFMLGCERPILLHGK